MKKRFVTAWVLAVAVPAMYAGSACAGPMTVDQDTSVITQEKDPYFIEGTKRLKQELATQPITNQAKNIILFVADGNGVSTVFATRVFEGQQRGQTGEENVLSYEKLPYLGLAKTYNTNYQVPDSAGTSTALHAGVKTKKGVIGVNSDILVKDFESAEGKDVTSVLELAEMAGMSTGVISTARVTHATPAAAYAHSASRNWEDDKDFLKDKKSGGKDIARQLIEFPLGNGLEVALGGGRRSFIPATMDDPEYAPKKGERQDGRNLALEWTEKFPNAAYVWNEEQFKNVDPAKTDHLLGLFQPSHMQYETDRVKDKAGEPSLAEMTEKSIEILSKNPKGYYLMVEGGRIDHANHDTNAYRAVTDGVAFAKAVETALKMTDPEDTLILVTADHSHTLTVSGYPGRGNNILGLVYSMTEDGTRLKATPRLGLDGKPYTTISYANGPGGFSGERPDLTNVDTTDRDFIQQAMIPMKSETHSGEDVAVYARGPWAHLIRGTFEQSYVYHVMDYAGQLRNRAAQGKTIR